MVIGIAVCAALGYLVMTKYFGATKRNRSQPVRKHASIGNQKSHQHCSRQLRKCKAVVPEKHDAYADELVDARQDRMDIPHDGVAEPKPAKDTTDAILRKALKAMKEKKA